MKAYPGRAKKFESPVGLYDGVGGGSFSGVYYNQPMVYQAWPSLSLPRGFQMRPPPNQGFQIRPPPDPASYHLYHGKRGHANEGDHYDSGRLHQFYGYQGYPEQEAGYGYQEGREREADILEALGEETSNLFQEAFQISSPRKKSKLSVKFARRLSKLVQTGRSATISPVPSGDSTDGVAGVHRPSRSYSVDSGHKPVLSRRQILASLEEENGCLGIPRPSPSLSSCTWSSSSPSPSPPHSENSFSSSPGTSEGVFSRACLIQSISREESASPRFGNAQVKLDSSGETIDSDRYDTHSEASEDDGDTQLENILDWEEDAKSFMFEPSGTDNSPLTADSDSELITEEVSPSTVTLESLTWVATLGVGGFGRVELVTGGNNNRPFALKKMKKNEIQDLKQQQHILNEKKIMQNCSSPFIVKLYQTFHNSKYLYMLMEPCLGGELWTVLRNNKRFSDSTARFYVACVILAFDYLHEKGVIYRDLKPENLLLDSSGYIKLTDFGFAKQLAVEEKAWTFCGTPEYVAPEIITNKSHDYRADIWSLGILVFELLTGAPPFTNKANPAQVYPEILKGIRGVCFPSCISASASEIIRQCCRLSPSQRPSLHILKHYIWFAGLDWVRLADRSLPPPKVPRISSSVDSSNFDSYKLDRDEPEEDFSEWAANF
eukprot:TRINITY_DN924_c0_g1_i4.p1 TRINITY_DN924_c0_g1~~TRINITY_DN924_c0_g1_i4.p1  ORF type:complete len:662 (-),score=161.87 TRINITY_DN924_c0_g1_i4:121-2106(-)